MRFDSLRAFLTGVCVCVCKHAASCIKTSGLWPVSNATREDCRCCVPFRSVYAKKKSTASADVPEEVTAWRTFCVSWTINDDHDGISIKLSVGHFKTIRGVDYRNQRNNYYPIAAFRWWWWWGVGVGVRLDFDNRFISHHSLELERVYDKRFTSVYQMLLMAKARASCCGHVRRRECFYVCFCHDGVPLYVRAICAIGVKRCEGWKKDCQNRLRADLMQQFRVSTSEMGVQRSMLADIETGFVRNRKEKQTRLIVKSTPSDFD